MRYRMVLEYDGTNYWGWQEQPAGPTVAATLKAGLLQVTGERPVLQAAGRTDAGAHSLGQVVSFELERDFAPARLVRALNGVLPKDVAVVEAAEAEAGFHARFSARRRTYRYLVENRPERGPVLRDRAWQVRSPLDLGAMRQAAGAFVGEHDLSAFGTDPAGRNTVRILEALRIRRLRHNLLAFDLVANAFLYGMVRRMVGFLVEVGIGKRSATDAASLLEPGARSNARVAPARGLYQLAVEY